MKTYEIHHRLGIATTPKKLFAALTDAKLLQSWWSEGAEGESVVGGVIQFRFGDFKQPLTVTALDPAKLLRWRGGAEGIPQWAGTEIEFRIEPDKENSQILLDEVGVPLAKPQGAAGNRERQPLSARDCLRSRLAAEQARRHAMSEFVYLYRESSQPSPQELQARMQKWLVWFKDLEQKGHLAVYGHPLNRTDGGVVRKGTVTDGPYAETKDIVIGFSVIEAKDFEQAVNLAAGCPLVESGGLVEVRPVLKM